MGNSEATPKKKDEKETSNEPVKAPSVSRAQFMQLETTISEELSIPPEAIQRMYDIKVNLEVVLGSSKMTLNEVLKLNPGGVVELNKLAGEPVDIIANNKLIARAEIVVIEDNFGVKILEIVGNAQKLQVV
jgi:flagellar motor switch protein FliN/FliY